MEFQEDAEASGMSDRVVEVPTLGHYEEDHIRNTEGDVNAVLAKRIKVEVDNSCEEHSASREPSSDDSSQSQSDSSLKTASAPCETKNGYGVTQASSAVHSNGEHVKLSAGIAATQDPSRVIRGLEEEIARLSSLLRSKELEWNAIVKLKRLKEMLLDRLTRRKDILAQLQCLPNAELDLRSIIDLIATEKVKAGPDQFQTERSTEKFEVDTKKAERDVCMDVSLNEGRPADPVAEFKASPVDPMHLDQRNASMALQELCERNRSYMSNASFAKVIGEGRQGTVLDVRSIIAEHRGKRKMCGDGVGLKKNVTFPDPLLQSPSISYTDVLLTLAKISQHETKSSVDESCPSVPAFGSAYPRPSGSTIGGTIGAPPGKTRNPLSSTLAKLLSSSSTPNGISRPEDSGAGVKEPLLSTAMQSAGAETDNLSLASLLTLSKNRDEKIRSDEEPVPLCQGCNGNRAQFVCAGCGNQWYCSRDCQVTAWDEHSDVCSG